MAATTAVLDTTRHAATATVEAVQTAVSASVEVAAVPLRDGARILSGHASAATLTRRCWAGAGRAWIEVRGLDGPDGAERAAAVVDALTGRPGVSTVRLNRPLSRVVVEIDDDQVSLSELCTAVADAEQRTIPATGGGTARPGSRQASLPGDGLMLAVRGALVAANAAGLAVAVTGRALRWPQAPVAVDAAAALANYQPWVRRLLADRIGAETTDTMLSLAETLAHVVTLSPATLTVDLMMHALGAVETRAGVKAWARHEPALARHAEEQQAHAPQRPVPAPPGAVERHTGRVAWVQALSTGALAALSRTTTTAANAAVVTAPKAMRTSTEAFAATLGAGLADQQVLTLQPQKLRRLGDVDALLIDPRVLCEPQLRVVQVRGADTPGLPAAWTAAQRLLDEPDLAPGWHPLTGVAGRGGSSEGNREVPEALILPAHHRLSTALLTAARTAELVVATVDVDLLGEMRPAFDELQPPDAGRDLDAALLRALTRLQHDGRTVAVLSTSAAAPLSSADLGLGVLPAADSAPPWSADVLLPDLAAAWRVLHALPAAQEATRRGIAISIGASSLGALFMVPGVRRPRGRGPGPVTAGAAAGLLSGALLARASLRAPTPRPAPNHEWHALSVRQVAEVLGVDDADRPAPADREATETPEPPMLVQFAHAVREELADPLTPVLALCSVATAVLGSPIDALMVGTVLTGNAMLAAGQRLQAEKRLTALLAQQTPPARLVLNGSEGPEGPRECDAAEGAGRHCAIDADRLLPGDIIEVHSNEVVPADARVIAQTDLEVDESALTGESLSVTKQVEATPGVELAERRCMLYGGTTVVTGTATAMVTAVGPDTQARRATELAGGPLPEVGLQYQLSRLMTRAFPVSAGGGVLVGALGLLRGGGLRQALGNTIAVAIAAVPEGMPLMATLAQHASSRRLARSGALVRVPRSVEALGRLDVVCFDKTGTLSENRLRVTRVTPAAGHHHDEVISVAAQAAPDPQAAAHAHATDQAIIDAAAGLEPTPSWSPPDAQLPFRSGRAFSASLVGRELTVKGAPEVVLAACDDADAATHDAVLAMAADGLRVIAVARRALTAAQARRVRDDPDAIGAVSGTGLRLTGFLGLADTARPQSPRLLAALADRGVAIRMITGDHPVTATAIAADLGVTVGAEQVITGSQWAALTRKQQEQAVSDRVIFARMSPENKVQIVQTLERAGKVCAMVGDGANDAAAIRAATVGIGVVARGSDAAHATADVVLTEGRIEALIEAVDEGRRLWRGVQAAVGGLLGGNAGEVLFSIIGTAVTGNSPLNTRQLLLMNTLTDALPATAVAVSTPRGPVQRVAFGVDERQLWRTVVFRGGVTAAAGTAAWAMAALTGRPQRASTVALIALVAVELGQTVVDSRAPLVLVTAAGSMAAFTVMVSTPGVSQLLGCTPVGPLGWAQALGSAAAATAAVAVAARPGARADAPEPDPGATEPVATPPARRARPRRRPAGTGRPQTTAPALHLVR
ncbi:cation-translocating P-type ATPase [Mycobacterium koreense]|uniref:Haloacid dehalogenase n=1 Tax=Mycolicibacillus koreensis TaxID=1069220 RepID=A0AA91PFF8_9MYCO|nr:cation-translocating P-type ATPase [Mycolicibacillus koreensis]MCV7250355.1 cation-translocating P-type ATPase [Mycolicibacillus koreensis]OSC33704.1 haloacid dehalogenase [Mycolicibacillus koreensis]